MEDHFFIKLLLYVRVACVWLLHFLSVIVEGRVVEWQWSPLAKYFEHIYSRPPCYGIVRRGHIH